MELSHWLLTAAPRQSFLICLGECRALASKTPPENVLKLDLLYEVDAPKPWGAPHPRGQRERERRAYDEAIEQGLGVRGYLVEDNPAPYFVEFLRQVVRLDMIRRQLPQKISDLRLVASNQLAERGCVL